MAKKKNKPVDSFIKPTPKQNAIEVKDEEKKDLFMTASEKTIDFIENNRKKILIALAMVFSLTIVIIVFSFLRSMDREQTSNLYYDANLNIFEKIKDAGDDIIGGGKITDDEIVRLVKDNKKLVEEASRDNIEEVYLAKYNLGITYYSIGDYDNSSFYFKEAYKHKDDFYLSFQALLNLGHSLYNRGYNYHKQDKDKKAEESYRSAIETYIKFTKEFPNSPSLLLAYRYLGLSNESLASLYQKMQKKDKEKNTLKGAIKYYKEYYELAKNKEGKLRIGYLADVFMRRGVVEDASLAIRRAEINLEKISN